MTGGSGQPDPDDRLADLDRELLAAEARSVQLERENRRLRDENRQLRSRLEAVYASETFRLGETLLRVPRAIKQRLDAMRGGPAAASPGYPPSTRARPSADPSLVVRYDLDERTEARRRYERIAGRTTYGAGRVKLAMAVYTTDLDEGRGDVYTACGLALALEPLGYDVVLLPPERWYDPPSGTEVVLVLVAEPNLQFEPQRLRSDALLLAWVRNNTDRWAQLEGLALFDGLFASSSRTADVLRRRSDAPIEVLPIGVDHDLFAAPAGSGGRRGALATINQWGPERPRRVYEFLANVGVDVPLAIHGVQHGLDPHLDPFAAGAVSYFALPSAYAQAAVVLDDQQDVNRRFGNVNSRVFEALASGALPITGAPRGLDEAGLGEVPTFDTPAELLRTTRRWLDDETGRTELVARLCETVLQRHTYEARARSLDDVLSRWRVDVRAPSSRGTRPLLVGFLPDYRATNPYQRMVYATIGPPGSAALPVSGPSDLAAAARDRGAAAVLHLHWTATVLGPSRNERDAEARAERFLTELDEAKRAGVGLAWTIHNVLPHDCAFPSVEARLRQGIADRADAVHVMCDRTVDEVAPHYTLPSGRIHTIPHGSYIDVYPNLVSRADARAELGVPERATTFLFLGQIRPYKGLEDLLDAFQQLARTDPDVHLLVAGKPVNHPGATELERRCLSDRRITPTFEEVADEDLQVYLNACDVMVLPHRRVLNSGGVVLAYAFGRPVVAPRTGCLVDQVSPDTGMLFDDERSLPAVLADARALATPEHRHAAYAQARAYTALDMAHDVRNLLEGLNVQ